jgi:hypothetical protein
MVSEELNPIPVGREQLFLSLVLEELRAIRALLEKLAIPTEVVTITGSAPARGEAAAGAAKKGKGR